MVKTENITAKDGYLIDSETGKKVVFYECDPEKNTACDKALCRLDCAENARGFGGCSKTHNPAYRKDGGRAFYAKEKIDEYGSSYWGREYIEEV